MNSFSWFRKLSPIAFLSFVAVASMGCVAEPPDELAPGDEAYGDVSSEALSTKWKCDLPVLGTSRCQDALVDIRGQAASMGRSGVIERGIDWLEDGNTYNRGASHEGFRRDCSGFVSMAWEISANPSTAGFPPFVNGTYAMTLGSLDELAPGDAVNRTYRNPYGHIMLFAGWASADHNELYFMHHYSTGKPVALIKLTRSQLGEFTPIRSVDVPAPEAAPPPEPKPPVTPPPAGCGVLVPGQVLLPNQGVTSCDGRFTLIQQGDGNLVLYKANAGALWSTSTLFSGDVATIMKEDGELVVYGPNWTVMWTSKTSGYPGAWLAVQDDGNLVIYHDKAIWNSGTWGN